MERACEINIVNPEIVFYDCKESMLAHQTLFDLPDDSYLFLNEPVIEKLKSTGSEGKGRGVRIHLSLLWQNIVSLSLWNESPGFKEARSVFKSIGLSDETVNRLASLSFDEQFSYFYESKDYDPLRKVCSYAIKRAEFELFGLNLNITCHLVSPSSELIVASSL